MTTLRQIESNRRNAQKSTGPKTDEGKQVSRGNSVRHGMAGAGLVLKKCDEEAVQTRLIEWAPSFPHLKNEAQNWMFVDLVRASVRVDRCSIEENLVRERAAQRAGELWDSDRIVAIEKLGLSLNKRPELTARILDQTAHGCGWKCDIWTSLAERITAGLPWTDTQQTLALDLLGHRKDCRDVKTPLDVATPDASPEEVMQHRLTVIRDEINRLEAKMSGPLAIEDRYEREEVLGGFCLGLDSTVNRVDRYLTQALKRFDKAYGQFQDARKDIVRAANVRVPLSKAEREARMMAEIDAELEADLARERAQEVAQTEVATNPYERPPNPGWKEFVTQGLDRLAEALVTRFETNPVEGDEGDDNEEFDDEDCGPEAENEDRSQAFPFQDASPTTVSKAARPKMNRQQRRALAKKRRVSVQ